MHDELTANFSYGKMHGNPTKLPFQYNPLPTFTIKINLNLCLSVVLLSAIPADPGGGLTYKKHRRRVLHHTRHEEHIYCLGGVNFPITTCPRIKGIIRRQRPQQIMEAHPPPNTGGSQLPTIEAEIKI